MKFTPLPLVGAWQIELEPKVDDRGDFTRLFCLKELAAIGHTQNIAQTNLSRTRFMGTVRGMHFQNPPLTEVKLVTCLIGRAFDVIVDIRRGSNTFLRWQSVELSGENRRMVYIPAGFAHGFQSLGDETELIYFHTEFYDAAAEDGLRFDDEALRIAWPRPPVYVSQRDRAHALISARDFTGISP